MVKVLSDMGLIGAADQNLIVRYVTAWVRWRRVAQTLVANPGAEYATYKDEAGKVKSVQLSALNIIARSLSEELGRAEAALGMSPASRSRIEVSMPSAPAANEKARFFDAPPLRIAE